MKNKILFFILLFLVSFSHLPAQRFNAGFGLYLQPDLGLSSSIKNYYNPGILYSPNYYFEDYEIKAPDGFGLGASVNLRFAISKLTEQTIYWIDIRPQLGLMFIKPYEPKWHGYAPTSRDGITWEHNDQIKRTLSAWSVPVLFTATYWLPYNGVTNRMLAFGAGLSVNKQNTMGSADTSVEAPILVKLRPYQFYYSYSMHYQLNFFAKAELRASYIWIGMNEREWETYLGFSIGGGKQYAVQLGIIHRLAKANYSEKTKPPK